MLRGFKAGFRCCLSSEPALETYATWTMQQRKFVCNSWTMNKNVHSTETFHIVLLIPSICFSPLPWKRLYLDLRVHYFHKSHVLNELQLIQNMMLVDSKLPKTFEIFTQTSDFVFFPMVPPLHICWNTGDRLIKSGVLFYTILLYFTMWNPTFV